MTNQEISNTFDTLLNSYNTLANFGEQSSKEEIVLDEYEKSVLLTQAQDIIIKSYFDKSLNSQGQGFDDSIRRQVDFSSLIKVATLSRVTNASTFDDRGIVYQFPKKSEANDTTDVLFILNEKLTCTTTISGVVTKKNFVIIPISYREYDKEMSKPYAQPLKKQVWRLFQNQTTGFDINSELIPKFDITEDENNVFTYKVRYVKRPRPIILVNLPDGLEIDGISTESSCELNPILHMDILNKAVEIAITTRGRSTYQTPAVNNS